ncbi:MAG TPA: CoA-transferase, partial [Acidimicrobiales bacterium]|nr:CoA-transferase [Acidimicrobiales bacterium]
AGLGSDLLVLNERLRTVRSPYSDEELVAAPALELDAAICHLNVADERGNAAFLGSDLYFDDLFLRAARAHRYISVEQVVPPSKLLAVAGTEQRLRISRLMVDGVVEAPLGAHFTECLPEYGRDEALQSQYAGSAASPEAFAAFRGSWIDLSEDEYRSKVEAS